MNKLRIRVLKDELFMNKGLSWDDAEEVDEALGFISDISSDGVTAGGGIKDGEVDIGVGISRVKEAAKADSITNTPEFENTINVNKVIKEASVFMPTLPCAYRAEDSHQGREFGVDVFKLAAEEWSG